MFWEGENLYFTSIEWLNMVFIFMFICTLLKVLVLNQSYNHSYSIRRAGGWRTSVSPVDMGLPVDQTFFSMRQWIVFQ